jgi:hypothetical protein
MKENFLFSRNGNEYYHKDHPSIRLDKEEFEISSDYEIENFIQSRIDDINKDLNTKSPKKIHNPKLSTEDILKSLAELKRKINEESFKAFFMKKIHSNR